MSVVVQKRWFSWMDIHVLGVTLRRVQASWRSGWSVRPILPLRERFQVTHGLCEEIWLGKRQLSRIDHRKLEGYCSDA